MNGSMIGSYIDPKLLRQLQQMQNQYGSSGASGQNMQVKFKPGDVVECVDPYSMNFRPIGDPGSGFRPGLRFTVSHVDNDHTGDWRRDIIWPPNGSGVFAEYLIIISNAQKEKEEEPKSADLDFTPLSRLIIAEEAKEEIISVLKQHQHSRQIFEEWGLGEVIEYGRGMTFLFYGPPGTGKTWGAHCIAKTLKKELLIIGSAEIQSSEPGAANRNIKKAFADAKSRNKILFLDECDSLIASRQDVGMVLGSEINTLLTEIEKFEGVVVLATNRVEELDEALERRIALIVEFPEPNYTQREGIWGVMLPKKMPLEKEVTIEKLAAHKLTGGQIKNIVLQAARLALANEAKKVGLKHFESAIARVQKSKSLLGTASRYRNFAMKDSFEHGTRVGGQVKKRMHKDIDVDIKSDIKEETNGPREDGEVRT